MGLVVCAVGMSTKLHGDLSFVVVHDDMTETYSRKMVGKRCRTIILLALSTDHSNFISSIKSAVGFHQGPRYSKTRPASKS